MNSIVKINILLLSAALCIACSSSPAPFKKSSPSADYQKAKAAQAQKELASEISKQD